MTTPQDIKATVSQTYAEQISAANSCCDSECGCGATYAAADPESMPNGVVSFGCGNPVALASLRRGQTVLDLGSGSVDVIISNCVINLAPDKDAVFREAFRALQSGGRLMVSYIVLTRPATCDEKADMALLTGCISGSLPLEEYTEKIWSAGFVDVQVNAETSAVEGQFWFSAAISASKPRAAFVSGAWHPSPRGRGAGGEGLPPQPGPHVQPHCLDPLGRHNLARALGLDSADEEGPTRGRHGESLVGDLGHLSRRFPRVALPRLRPEEL